VLKRALPEQELALLAGLGEFAVQAMHRRHAH
jgi:hypothetical protein